MELEQQQWRNLLSDKEADIINHVMLRDSRNHSDGNDDDDANRHSLEAAAAAAAASEDSTAQIANAHAHHEKRKHSEEILRQFLISVDDVQLEKRVGAGGELTRATLCTRHYITILIYI